jgi:hypothetical protein
LQYLDEVSFEAETRLWRRLCTVGVYLTPGGFMASAEPGWMRLVFTATTDELEEGLRRLANTLKYLTTKEQGGHIEKDAPTYLVQSIVANGVAPNHEANNNCNFTL